MIVGRVVQLICPIGQFSRDDEGGNTVNSAEGANGDHLKRRLVWGGQGAIGARIALGTCNRDRSAPGPSSRERFHIEGEHQAGVSPRTKALRSAR